MGRPPAKYSRVTSVISFLDSFWYQFWVKAYGVAECERISRESTDFGKAVHGLVEAHLLGQEVPLQIKDEKGTIPITPRHKFSAGLITKWCTEAKVIPLTAEKINEGKPCIELPLVSEKYKLTGHPDLINVFGDSTLLWMTDWKTSKDCRRGYALQLAAYAVMAKEQYGLEINDGAIVRTPSDPTVSPQFETHEFHNLKEKYWPIFEQGLSVYNYFNSKGMWSKKAQDEAEKGE